MFILSLRLRPDSDDDELDASAIFKSQENFARYLIIKSTNKYKPITSLSPFVIEKQIEATIGTAKSVKKLKNETLLVESVRKQQTENLLKMKSFFAIPVEVSEHKTLNSSKGIIRDRIFLQLERLTKLYLQIHSFLPFTVKPQKSVKIFYQIIPVEMYVPNPLRCFNCQKFGHYESNCPAGQGSVCERCGSGNNDHQAHQCK